MQKPWMSVVLENLGSVFSVSESIHVIGRLHFAGCLCLAGAADGKKIKRYALKRKRREWMKKRFLTTLLTLCMTSALLLVPAFAADDAAFVEQTDESGENAEIPGGG